MIAFKHFGKHSVFLLFKGHREIFHSKQRLRKLRRRFHHQHLNHQGRQRKIEDERATTAPRFCFIHTNATVTATASPMPSVHGVCSQIKELLMLLEAFVIVQQHSFNDVANIVIGIFLLVFICIFLFCFFYFLFLFCLCRIAE